MIASLENISRQKREQLLARVADLILPNPDVKNDVDSREKDEAEQVLKELRTSFRQARPTVPAEEQILDFLTSELLESEPSGSNQRQTKTRLDAKESNVDDYIKNIHTANWNSFDRDWTAIHTTSFRLLQRHLIPISLSAAWVVITIGILSFTAKAANRKIEQTNEQAEIIKSDAASDVENAYDEVQSAKQRNADAEQPIKKIIAEAEKANVLPASKMHDLAVQAQNIISAVGTVILYLPANHNIERITNRSNLQTWLETQQLNLDQRIRILNSTRANSRAMTAPINVRYFHPDDKTEADAIAIFLRSEYKRKEIMPITFSPETHFYPSVYRTPADFPKRYFEIWIAEQAFE